MRVLIGHTYYTQRGGEDVVFEDEASLLEASGHEVTRYSVSNDDLGSSPATLAINTVWNCESARKVSALVNEHRIEVAHFHNIFPQLSPSVFQAAHKAGAAVVKTLHNFRVLCPKAVFFRDGKPCFDCQVSTLKLPAIRHGCYRDSRPATVVSASLSATHRWLRTYRDSVDALIAPTHYVKEKYESSRYPLCPIHVKPHFIHHDLGFATGAGGFALYVGRISDEKGLVTLLNASRSVPQVPLKIVGTGPLEGLLDSLPDHIQWLGKLEQHDVYHLMGQAACVVVPSDCGETFGRVVVEAFSRGTPVICSAHGGQAEIVKPHVGDQFVPGDASDLATKLAAFFHCQTSILNRRQAAREEFLSHYTSALNYDRMMEIYEFARHRNRSTKAGHHNQLG